MPGILRATRRDLLRRTLVLSGIALGTSLLRPAEGLAAACRLTPAQSEGPFYPRSFGTPDNDLLLAPADGALPRGEPIAIVGHVTDAACRPLSGAVVEVWQADAAGRYAHASDSKPGERDPAFRYWGRAVTDAEGLYRFRTLLPAAYRMGWGWRTPHVHVKVRPPAGRALTTQMYFAGHERNADDSLLRSLSAAEREAVLTHPAATDPGLPAGQWPGLPRYRFDIALA